MSLSDIDARRTVRGDGSTWAAVPSGAGHLSGPAGWAARKLCLRIQPSRSSAFQASTRSSGLQSSLSPAGSTAL
eukprot:6281656-Prymnesium_polylepis.1